MNNILFYPNPTKRNIKDAATCVLKYLEKFHGINVLIPDECRPVLPEGMPVKTSAMEKCLESSDMLLVLGGDGSILHVAQDAAENDLPILGINLGRIGFMTELEADELQFLDDIIRGNFRIDKRMMLDVKVFRDDKVIFNKAALNDAAITKGEIIKMIEIALSSDSCPLIKYSGDGVIISTPTGSTAYSFAAGGPIVEPTSENIIITPICAHALNAKPFVLSSCRVVGIEPLSITEKAAYLSVDGGSALRLIEGDIIKVQKSQLYTRLIRIKDTGFYEIISRKLSNGGSV